MPGGHLGAIRCLQEASKSTQNVCKKPSWASNRSEITEEFALGALRRHFGVILAHLGLQDASKSFQDASEARSRAFKTPPRTFKMPPRTARMYPGGLSPLGNSQGILLLARPGNLGSSRPPRRLQQPPRRLQEPSRRFQDAPKTRSIWPKNFQDLQDVS